MTQPTIKDIEKRIDDEGQMKFLKEWRTQQEQKKAKKTSLAQRIKKALSGKAR